MLALSVRAWFRFAGSDSVNHTPVFSLMHLHSSLLLGRLAIAFIVDYGIGGMQTQNKFFLESNSTSFYDPI